LSHGRHSTLTLVFLVPTSSHAQRVLAEVDVARQQPLVYHASASQDDVSQKPLVILLGWLMSKQVRYFFQTSEAGRTVFLLRTHSPRKKSASTLLTSPCTSQKHLDKFADWYLQRSIDAVSLLPRPSHVLSVDQVCLPGSVAEMGVK
jgi:hypothetical protein